MSKICISIPKNQPELEIALQQFVTDEFNQQPDFSDEPPVAGEKKSVELIDILWNGLVFFATVEGTLQFAERAKRMERVNSLLEKIKQIGQAVYLKIDNERPIEMSKKTVDEIMDILSNIGKK